MSRVNYLMSALINGVAIGELGGLIGLGVAEFRLPILKGMFGFPALEAIILNKAMSLIVVASALPFRTLVIPFNELWNHAYVVAILLSGSLIGAWSGAAGWATRLKSQVLYKIIAILLIFIAIVLFFGHGSHTTQALLSGWSLAIVGAIAGIGIGFIASLLGVAGGELLIPTITLLFGIDIKIAGSLSLMISLPTMLVGFLRYSQNQSFVVIRKQWQFMLFMATGSIIGTYLGSLLLGVFPTQLLLALLSYLLVLSAWKIWKHA
jgi:hypothetical protein